MPWHGRPMKDAVGVRYASGRNQTSLDPKISEWVNPSDEESETPAPIPQYNMSPLDPLNFRDQEKGYFKSCCAWGLVRREGTRRTETSK